MSDLVERTGLFRVPFATAMRRARGLPRSAWGTMFAHAGVGVALIGIVCETTWNSEYIGSMKPDDVARIAGYELKLDGMTQRQGPNYREMVGAVHGQPRRQAAQHHDAVEAQLHDAGSRPRPKPRC